MTKRFTRADIDAFASVSGDHNPLHHDRAFAAGTVFGEPIAHGFLAVGLISAVIGTRLPGAGSIYLSQSVSFKAAVKPGDEVTARVEVLEIMAKGRVRLLTECRVGETPVLDGEALVIAPRTTASGVVARKGDLETKKTAPRQ